MSESRTPNSWSLPKHDSPCGPQEIADAVISYRKFQAIGPKTAVSDQNITKLIELCYHTSLAPEEGLYPRFRVRLIDRPISPGTNFVTAILESGELIEDVESLRKLVPSVSSFEYALGLEEKNGKLYCTHLRLNRHSDSPPKIGWPNLFDQSDTSAIDVQVNGPGDMYVSAEGVGFSLRRGELTQLAPFDLLTELTEWLHKLGRRLQDECVEAGEPDDAKLFGGHTFEQMLVSLWSRIMLEATNRHRGATFVVIPLGSGEKEIACKYQISDYSLAIDMQNFWFACRDYVKAKEGDQIDKLAGVWRRRHQTLVSKAKSLANMGRVDGCVLLDQNFQVLGFGGKIGVGKDDADKSPLKYAHFFTKELQSEDDLKGGMRHQSAYRLCKVTPGALAFVVSQDGDLTVFLSDKDFVYDLRVAA